MNEIENLFITQEKQLKRIYIRKDTHEKLKQLQRKFNISSMDILIRVMIHSLKTVMCFDAYVEMSKLKNMTQQQLDEIKKKYPECDLVDYAVKPVKKSGQIIYVKDKTIGDLLKPIKVFTKYAKQEQMRQYIKETIKEIL